MKLFFIKRKSLIFIILLAITASSCMKDNSEELKAKENRLLANYLTTHQITTQPKPSGLYFIPITQGSGISPIDQDLVLVSYNIKNISDQVVYTTSLDVATKKGLPTTDRYFGPERWIVNLNTSLLKGFMEGLTLMKSGDSATLITPSELAFKEYGWRGIAGSYETVIWDVKLENVIKDPLAYEKQLITAYLDTVGSGYDSTADGLIKITDVEGYGELPANDSSISVQYKLFLIEGYKIDETTQDFNYVINQNSSNYIAGWDKAMRLMRRQEKCRIIIPYKLAYGFTGYRDVPPCATIVYQFVRTK